MNHHLAYSAVVTAAGLLLAGCGGASPARPALKVTGAYMPAPVGGGLAAGFLTISNSGGSDTLTSVTSQLAGDVTLHSSKGGAMKEEKSFAVPADGSLDFASGGNHLMFEQLSHKPEQGDTVTVQLHFARSGTVTVEMPVKSATYNPKTGH